MSRIVQAKRKLAPPSLRSAWPRVEQVPGKWLWGLWDGGEQGHQVSKGGVEPVWIWPGCQGVLVGQDHVGLISLEFLQRKSQRRGSFCSGSASPAGCLMGWVWFILICPSGNRVTKRWSHFLKWSRLSGVRQKELEPRLPWPIPCLPRLHTAWHLPQLGANLGWFSSVCMCVMWLSPIPRRGPHTPACVAQGKCAQVTLCKYNCRFMQKSA